jgi:DnaJ-class molecular chaperone
MRAAFEESFTAPEPPTPAAPQPKPVVTETGCGACNGFGWYTMVELSGGRRYEARETCDFCHGHGKLAA